METEWVLHQLQDSLNPFYNNATNWWKYVLRTGKITNVALGIRHVDANTAELLADRFPTLEALQAASTADLLDLDGNI